MVVGWRLVGGAVVVIVVPSFFSIYYDNAVA